MYHLQYKRGEILVIESFEDVKGQRSIVQCKIKWRGFDAAENDWVQYETLKHDVLDMLKD